MNSTNEQIKAAMTVLDNAKRAALSENEFAVYEEARIQLDGIIDKRRKDAAKKDPFDCFRIVLSAEDILKQVIPQPTPITATKEEAKEIIKKLKTGDDHA